MMLVFLASHTDADILARVLGGIFVALIIAFYRTKTKSEK